MVDPEPMEIVLVGEVDGPSPELEGDVDSAPISVVEGELAAVEDTPLSEVEACSVELPLFPVAGDPDADVPLEDEVLVEISSADVVDTAEEDASVAAFAPNSSNISKVMKFL